MKRILIGIILIAGINVYAQTYDPEKAAEYANFWCDKRNTASSPYFDPIKWGGPYIDYGLPQNGNGDCAAFVSQCLKYGGLDLSKGTNGSGAFVKPIDGVIAGATQLVEHLTGYQKNNFERKDITGFSPPAKHDVGDPMFIGYSGWTGASHSYFCSSLDFDGRQLYSSHTSTFGSGCNDRTTFQSNQPLILFLMKRYIPSHCDDCIQNNGETGIDCGGPCPPCQDAEDNVNYNINNQQLPQNTYAIERIEAGNANVQVLAGQNVTFKSTGTIVLKPGFKAQSGSNFKAEIAGSRREIMRYCEINLNKIPQKGCGKYCEPHRYTCWEQQSWGGYGWKLTNVHKATVIIYQICNGNSLQIHGKKTINVTADGFTELWNIIDGIKTDATCHQDVFYYDICLYPCNGSSPRCYYDAFHLRADCNPQSLTPPDLDSTFNAIRENIEQEDAEQFLIHPNPNNGTFTIKTGIDPQEIVSIRVLTPLGLVLYEQEGLPSRTIQLPSSAKGVYFVEINTIAQRVIRKMVVY